MDSPIRQYQKQKDYQRHKLFRKIKRRRKAQAKQEAEAPLREMRKRVLKRFKDGKDKGISDQQYYSIMERVAENNNNEWNKFRTEEGGRPLSVDEEYLRILNDNSYNYRGYYNKYPSGSGNALDHWTDEFKTVWHPSFSTQSRYSGKVSQYNPYGVLGGKWNGDSYVPAWGQKLAPEPKQRGWFEYDKGKNIKRFDDGEDVVYELPDVPIEVSYVPKSNVRINPETGAVLTRDNREGALMLQEIEVKPKRRLEQVYKSDLDLSNPISKKIQNFSKKHYWDSILGAPARLQNSVDNESNPLVALGSIFGVPDSQDLLASANLNYIQGRIKSIKKGLNRLKTPLRGEGGLVNNYSSDWHNNTVRRFEENFLQKDPKFYEYPDKIERARFMQNYKRFQSDLEQSLWWPSATDLKNAGIDDYRSINRAYDLFKHNPEYFKHWIQTDMSKNPLDQQTVADFIKRQGRSIRGVTAKNQEDAIRYLTTTQGGRHLAGGDRLNTHGGLYVSNHPEIADRFKNPVGDRAEDGYVGVLNYDFKIPANLPIEDQLKLYRNSIYKYDGPLLGTFYDIMDKYPEGTRAVESVYVGRANNGSGIERAYLPLTERGKVDRPVTIEKLNHYPKQTDQRGRWFSDIKNLPVQTDMFIPKEYNSYDDFVRTARQFLKGKPNVYSKEYIDAVNKYGGTLQRQEDFRRELLDKLLDRQNKLKDIKRYITNFGIISGAAFGGTALYSKIKSDQKMWNEFEDSQEYQNYVNEIRQFEKEKDERERVRKEQAVFDKYLQIFKDRNHYNSGKDSGIHINPKNRGKFNALKKRTGKTTEQLTHSKNPLTRKRAIFALNSKKFKH